MTLSNLPEPFPPQSPMGELAAPLRPLLALNLEAKIVIAVLIILSLWGLAILTFGVPALVWPMKLIVPTMVLGLALLVVGLL